MAESSAHAFHGGALLEYAVLERLMNQRATCRVDEVVGVIRIVDKEGSPIDSQVGKPQTPQDVVIETPDRKKIVIVFLDLQLRSFTGDRGDFGTRVNFGPEHIGCWIKVTNTQKEEKKASLKTIPRKYKPAQHWGSKGVQVALKATPSVRVEWLLEKGQKPPEMRFHAGFQKKKKQLQVPGGQQTQTRTMPREETTTMTNKEAQERAALAYVVTLAALQAAYKWAASQKLLDAPPDADFETAVSTLFIELKKKLNIFTAPDAEIRGKAKRAALAFIQQQVAVATAIKAEAEVNKNFTAPRAERLPKITQTCFIEVASRFPLLEEPSKKKG